MFVEVAASLFFIWLIWYILSTYQERKKMPPGPFPFPFIGNLAQLGPDPLDPFSKLVGKYGDIFTISFPQGTFVVLNSATLMREARVSRKDDLTGKLPKYVYPFNVIFGGRDLNSDYSPAFLFRKKIFKLGLHIFGAGIEEAEERVGHAVQNLLKEIEAKEGQAFTPKRLIASAIISQVWEWISSKKCSLDHPTVKSLSDFNAKIATLCSQGTVYKLFPFLSYLPTSYSRKLKEVVKTRDEIFRSELKIHRETYTSGVTRDLTDSFLRAYEKEIAKETGKDIGSIEDVQYLMLNVEFGASDTTSSALAWFILYMLLHQDVQRKIHEELDRVVGRVRLPRWNDAKNMPYLQATLCEVLRHSRLTPLLMSDAIHDTTIGGYHIPKRTAVFLNTYHLHGDERWWPEPEIFKPDRFLDADGMFVGWTSFPGFVPFGMGRRECPGQGLGKIIMFSFSSAIMHCFNFESAEGEPRPTLESAGAQLVLCPKDYKIVAKKRL